LTVAEGIEKLLALRIRCPAMNQWGIKARGNIFELLDIATDDEHLLLRMLVDDLPHRLKLRVGRGRNTVAIAVFRGCVAPAFLWLHIYAYFPAVRGRHVPRHSSSFPRGLITPGADERKHVASAAILAHERSC